MRAFGTALVVFFDSTGFRYKGRDGAHSDHYCNVEMDYQSGTKLPHSKGSAYLNNAHASNSEIRGRSASLNATNAIPSRSI